MGIAALRSEPARAMASNRPRGTPNRSQKRGHGLEALPRLTARLDVPRPAVAKASVAAKAAVAAAIQTVIDVTDRGSCRRPRRRSYKSKKALVQRIRSNTY